MPRLDFVFNNVSSIARESLIRICFYARSQKETRRARRYGAMALRPSLWDKGLMTWTVSAPALDRWAPIKGVYSCCTLFAVLLTAIFGAAPD